MKGKQPRTNPRIAGIRICGKGDMTASPNNSVYKHQQKYHVFVGLKNVMVTADMNLALLEAARKQTL